MFFFSFLSCFFFFKDQLFAHCGLTVDFNGSISTLFIVLVSLVIMGGGGGTPLQRPR